jgi:type I restriction enzyme M protein
MENLKALDNNNSVTNVKSELWRAVEILKREHVSPEDFHLILFLLTLQREGFISDLISEYSKGSAEISRAVYSVDFIDVFESTIDDEDDWKNDIIELYKRIISRIDYDEFADLLDLLNSLDQSVLKEHFAYIFEDLLYKLSKFQKGYSGDYVLPLELCRFVSQLVELPENAKVYNPFAGLASFGIFLKQDSFYVGQEINQRIWAIGALRINAYSRGEKSSLILGDSIRNWNPYAEKYDLIIANPPFNVRLPNELQKQFGNIKTVEHYFIKKGIEDLKADGKLIAVVAHGFLFRLGPEEDLREYLVDNDLLETVISFPGGILTNTAIPIAILVINNNKKDKGLIRFVDAKRFVDSTSIRDRRIMDKELASQLRSGNESESIRLASNRTIKEFDYNLDVHRHFAPKISVDDGIKKVKLVELVKVIKGQRNSGILKGKFVRIRDLHEDKLQYTLDVNVIKNIEIPKTAKRINESCILLATRWKTLKPTYFKYADDPIFIITDIIALKVDEVKVNISYLINELHSDFVVKTIDSYRIGDVIPYIRKEDILNITLPLLSLEEQKAKIQGIRETLAKEKGKELDLFKKIHGLEVDITEQNTHLRHSLAGPSSNLKGSFTNIKSIINEKLLPKFPELMNLKVSEEHEYTFGKYMEMIERDIYKIANSVGKQLKVDTGIESKKLKQVEIVSFLQNYVNEYIEKGNLIFEFRFDVDEETFRDSSGEIIETYIRGNKDLLNDLFNNLIDNAVSHAFKPDLKNRIDILLMRNSEIGKVNEIYILFSNTGRPFPEDFKYSDFVRKGSKAGINAGDGYGGWYINEIIKKMKGNLNIIDETGPEGLTETDLATSFEITFPIIDNGDDEKI